MNFIIAEKSDDWTGFWVRTKISKSYSVKSEPRRSRWSVVRRESKVHHTSFTLHQFLKTFNRSKAISLPYRRDALRNVHSLLKLSTGRRPYLLFIGGTFSATSTSSFLSEAVLVLDLNPNILSILLLLILL